MLESISYQFESSPSVNLDFNADVSTTFESTDAVLQNLSTSQLIPSSDLQLSFDSWEDAVSIVYCPSNLLTTAPLPDGNYRLTLEAGTIASVTGVPLASDVTIDFFVLAGDVNRDRIVNFNDLLIVAQNYGQPNRTFSQGNVDYSPDGLVNFSDLLIIAQQYGTSLPSLRVGQQFGSTRIALDVLKTDE